MNKQSQIRASFSYAFCITHNTEQPNLQKKKREKKIKIPTETENGIHVSVDHVDEESVRRIEANAGRKVLEKGLGRVQPRDPA